MAVGGFKIPEVVMSITHIPHRVISAHVALFSAVGLAVASFVLNQYQIDTSLLWYIAQCLVYSASMFGVKMAIDSIKRIISTKNTEPHESN